jgi:hydrogenase maturation protein HypF
MSDHRSARHIHITGVVQGVGFRPFVYNLATRLALSGWVLNSSSGVIIEAVGPAGILDDFVQRLRSEAPPLARIEQVSTSDISVSDVKLPEGDGFHIRHSEAQPGEFQPISPDISICEDCLREVLDPQDRRFRYPFINCTNCGPRFTIIQDIPYDRPFTTMAPFKMCADCQAEYDDPTDRRFHAQPNACPVCGPQLQYLPSPTSPLQPPTSNLQLPSPIHSARQLILSGGVLAVKGLGGFHLACDATNDQAVALLRERKGRVDKPFAVMSYDLAAVEAYCDLTDEERELLTSRERPIVLLRERPGSPISSHVAPGNKYLGVMVPYTPLHYLLLEPNDDFPVALVMTSGNVSEEPIAVDNDEALTRLADLADGFLMHDRDIHARCDDSVTRVFAGMELPIRRSRGYAPFPVHLPFDVAQVLAVGAELKNTFCLTRDRYGFLSQHIGDMENYETLRSLERMVEQLTRTFRIEPEVIACDMHPGYLATQYAQKVASDPQLIQSSADTESAVSRLPLIKVQHHHAHVAACMAENGLESDQSVIGVAFDGTGYGVDGAIWGGEFLVADYAGFRRVAHLKYMPLPGGDSAIRRPYRIGLSYLWAAGIPWEEDLAPVVAAPLEEQSVLATQLEQDLNVVPTSSVGRLFDAVSSLAGVRQEINYEAQAAIEMEMLVDDSIKEAYGFDVNGEIDPRLVIRAVASDVRAGLPEGAIAAKFHNGLATMVRDVCLNIRAETRLDQVALTGGVFQNVTLLTRLMPLLEEAGFTVLLHRLVPPNDGGISLGQAVVASVRQLNHSEGGPDA